MGNPAILVDLDGVIWRGESAIPGSAGAVEALRKAGATVAFFTNNSFSLPSQQRDKLARMGVPTEPGELLTSSQAAAQLLERGERALAVGGRGIVEALEERGVAVTEIASLLPRPDPESGGPQLAQALGGLADMALPSFDAVVVGIDPQFDYARLAIASRAVREGARLVATNNDATFPTPNGLVPGAGSVLAAVRVASGAEPVIAGKPYPPAADLVHARLGPVAWVIGDRPDTDGGMAVTLGAPFGLVLSGVTAPGHGPVSPEPALEAANLAALAEQLIERGLHA